MKLARLPQQLVKDLRKSPAKAAVLGGLSLVALYAWAPFVLRSGSDKQPDQAQVIGSQSVTVGQPAPVAASPRVGLPLPWTTLASAIDQDPNMRPASLRLGEHRPFSSEKASGQPVETPLAITESSTAADAVDARSFGLKVSGTMLGKHRRVAVINGRPYAEGRQLTLADDRTFTIAEVGARHVVLEGAGSRFELPVTDSGTLASAP